MLSWVGKKPLERLPVFPTQRVETFAPKGIENDEPNLLFHGDNKEVLAWLLANGYRGQVNLIYIDPPFDSAADYVRKVQLRGGKSIKMDGAGQSILEQVQYTDIWANDNYLQFMYERLLLLKELLSSTGSIYMHCDWHKSHHLRCLLDEVFGADCFQNEIAWCYTGPSGADGFFPRKHDSILFYTKGQEHTFEQPRIEHKSGVHNTGQMFSDEEEGDEERKKQMEEDGKKLEDWWIDIWSTDRYRSELTGYPTQKPSSLLERIIRASAQPGYTVLDCYMGSGTTLEVAQRLGCHWIGCDINKGAIQTTSKRLQSIIQEQVKKGKGKSSDEVVPASRAFDIYRVNDYDLQIQHNEALELAMEHIGVSRTKTDSFFDGTLGSELVKVIPLQHPCTLLDIQLIEDEIKRSRKNEDRNIIIVCLGKEAAVDAKIEQYNKTHPINKLRIIELRTDSKYGKFFEHKPCTADVSIERKGDKLHIEIKDFMSPSIIERLSNDEGILSVKIDDWRSMVDTVLIDTDYNGDTFNIVHTDVPEKKNDLVEGAYELDAPKEGSTVAVKLIDMLGEELLITKAV